MYCLYHGRQGLRNIATKIHLLTCDFAESLKSAGHSIKNETFFDTLKIHPKTSLDQIKQRASEKHINLRYYENGSVNNREKIEGDFIEILLFCHRLEFRWMKP